MPSVAATHMQLFDEAGIDEANKIGGPQPLDPRIMGFIREPDGKAEIAIADGLYQILGHIGNFTIGLQRVKKIAAFALAEVEAVIASPAMDMTKLSTEAEAIEAAIEPKAE